MSATFSAIALIASLLGSPSTDASWNVFLWRSIPRMTLAIFAELLTLFFLRVYRTCLADMKYFQNELTNVDFRFAALERAIKIGDAALLSSVVRGFSETERNFVLAPGESTVEIERGKTETTMMRDMIATRSNFGPSAAASSHA